MIIKSYISLIGLLIIALCASCDFDLDSKDKEPEINIKLNKGGFEGIIRLVEKNNSQKTDITFSISKDKIKREQIYRKGKSSQEIGGIIIDLKKDSVILYFENQTEKRKLLFTTQEYKLRLEENDLYSYYRTVKTYDDLYLKLNYYHRLLYKKDAFTYSDVHFDYNLYNDIHYRQTIFDSPQIKVNKELLPLLFPGIPDKAPFPVMYTLTSSNRKIHKSDSLQIDVEEPEGILEKILDVLPDIDTIDQELKSIDQKPMNDADFTLDPTKEYVLHTEGFETINASYLGGGGYGGDDDD